MNVPSADERAARMRQQAQGSNAESTDSDEDREQPGNSAAGMYSAGAYDHSWDQTRRGGEHDAEYRNDPAPAYEEVVREQDSKAR